MILRDFEIGISEQGNVKWRKLKKRILECPVNCEDCRKYSNSNPEVKYI